MTTALDTISGALRLLGVVGSGQVPAPEDSSNGLRVLNELLETLSIDGMAVFTPADQTFNLIPGVATYTLGPSGVWVGFRPIQVDQLRVLYQTIDYEVQRVDNERFNSIPYKTQTGILPLQFNYNPTATNGAVEFWPVPTQALPITITSDQQLTQIADTNTVLSFPPGYARMLRFNLAKDLQDEYGKQMSPAALQIADRSLGQVKRANIRLVPAKFDAAIGGDGGTGSYKSNFLAGL